MDTSRGKMTTLEQTKDLFLSVLGDDYLPIDIKKLILEDDIDSSHSIATIVLSNGKTLVGSGLGIVDAVFNCLFSNFSAEYPSLKSIEMTRFTVKTDQKTKLDPLGSSAVCEVSVETMNSRGKKFFFVDSSRSVGASSARCAARVAEHFINSERAYARTWMSLQSAKDRNRQDMVEKYILILAKLVENTSYSENIEGFERELDEIRRRNK